MGCVSTKAPRWIQDEYCSMKITELIAELQKILESDGDLPVWVDSTNEVFYGDIEGVAGKYFSGRGSNSDPHCYIVAVTEKGPANDGSGKGQ